MSEQERSKDARFTYKEIKNTSVGKGSKGELRVQLSFTKESIPALLEAVAALEGNERGVKFDIHVYDKEANGRTFSSTLMFVKPIQEFGANGQAASPTKFKNAFAKQASPVTTASVAAARNSVSNGVTKRLT